MMLVIPRSDGIVVSKDGVVSLKPLDAAEMLSLAQRCLDAGMEMLREEKADELQEF
jgi:hypothetical protein